MEKLFIGMFKVGAFPIELVMKIVIQVATAIIAAISSQSKK